MNAAAMTVPVRRAKPVEVAAITALLVTALAGDGVTKCLVPDPVERADVLHRLIAIDVDHAVETGQVDVTVDMSAGRPRVAVRLACTIYRRVRGSQTQAIVAGVLWSTRSDIGWVTWRRGSPSQLQTSL